MNPSRPQFHHALAGLKCSFEVLHRSVRAPSPFVHGATQSNLSSTPAKSMLAWSLPPSQAQDRCCLTAGPQWRRQGGAVPLQAPAAAVPAAGGGG